MEFNNPTTEQIPLLRDLWKEAFGDTDAFLDIFFSRAFNTKRSVCILENSDLLSALYFFDCTFNENKIAYIYGVATKKDMRGRGLCRNLMDYTHNLLKARGYIGAILVPAGKSLFDFYEKIGYKTTCCADEFEVSAQVSDIRIEEISKSEFALLRKDFLPEASVIQENENLDFLEAYAKFYKGEDFLMAGYTEKGKLTAAEFLGNTENAPYVVNALGCKNGKFRTPGTATPFAMYYNLSDKDNFSPKYFGLAFD